MAPIKLEIVRHGEVIRTSEGVDGNRSVAELEFTVPAEHGCWIAARAFAGDGTSAHTTPVYVVREGLRFWKIDALDALIESRLASLGQIEQMIAEAQSFNQEGRLDTDRYRHEVARQGDALKERIAKARTLYDDLRAVARAEAPMRAKP
jgi:hypothetical protein